MPSVSHEEIVHKFLNSKAVDFTALGKFVAEFGPQIAASGRGDYGVRIGHYNILACFKIVVPTDSQLIGPDASNIASDVLGGGR